jgi:hypothetical protein
VFVWCGLVDWQFGLFNLILDPDAVHVRLAPRVQKLEEPYVERYLNELTRLESLQGQLRELDQDLAQAAEFDALSSFASDVSEAQRILDEAKRQLTQIPPALRKSPEDRDRVEKVVRREAKVKDLADQDLTIKRLGEECEIRQAAQTSLSNIPGLALREFGAFLLSPGVREQLRAVNDPPKALLELLEADSAEAAAECLQTLPKQMRTDLAKLLKAALGKKRAKTVTLSGFSPKTDTIWEASDIKRVTKEFEDFLTKEWDSESYLKISPK